MKAKVWSILGVLFFTGVGYVAQAEDTLPLQFALQGGAAPFVTVDLQGDLGSESVMQRICGAAGNLCTCEVQDSNGKILGRTNPSQIFYEPTGNYFSCAFDINVPFHEIAKARIFRDKITSPVMNVNEAGSLTLPQIIGPYLDMNRTRSIFRYSCQEAFLQKEGTTTDSFDCSSQPVLCDTGDFCLLKADFPNHLFLDGYSSNFTLKQSDRIYNEGGSGRICGLQIKSHSCSGPESYPALKFGLFGEQKGIWKLPVALSPNQYYASYIYGYAAEVSPSTGRCPPGLEKKAFYQAAIDTKRITPSHNFATGRVVTEVADAAPGAPPSAFEIDKFGQGDCNGTTCTMPISYAGDATADQEFARTGSEFCVIPNALLDSRKAMSKK